MTLDRAERSEGGKRGGATYEGAEEEEAGEVERGDDEDDALGLGGELRAHGEPVELEADPLGLAPLLDVGVRAAHLAVRRREVEAGVFVRWCRQGTAKDAETKTET